MIVDTDADYMQKGNFFGIILKPKKKGGDMILKIILNHTKYINH